LERRSVLRLVVSALSDLRFRKLNTLGILLPSDRCEFDCGLHHELDDGRVDETRFETPFRLVDRTSRSSASGNAGLRRACSDVVLADFVLALQAENFCSNLKSFAV